MWKHRASSRPDPAPKDKDENPPRPLSNLGLFGRSRRSSRKGGFWLRGFSFLLTYFLRLFASLSRCPSFSFSACCRFVHGYTYFTPFPSSSPLPF
ncbi:hypothetical protein I7I50_04184 [Histoplasma capsulatum G186AR]|uniref:Uncharacterized protein n=1 Tax=Ajellomyces capsulatus TaxID=5037 RepID=A0A8H8CYT6_AJECA|nr:hypothetical protein I7I52_05092 [Histoplasma capsulatum]QSS75140.1 hypothetical protein I7I50_04184 [Histoplasma capsulatum G186AR]